MKQKREREEPCDICGHYHDYLGGEPCSVCGHRLEVPAGTAAAAAPVPKPPSAFPSEIVPNFLFLGSYDHVSRQEVLKTLGIRNILSTVPNCQPLYKNSFTYHTAPSLPPPLEECYAFLDEVQRKGEKVVVHCMSGLSRSAVVVVYYLMRRNGWRLSEAYQWVKDRRPQIAIKAEDAERMQEAEQQLLGPNASGFQVPLGQQPAAGQATHPGQQQQQGIGPFGWQPFGAAAGAFGGGGPAGVAFNPAAQPGLNFAASPAQGAFVFGGGGAQQQQQQHSEMMD